MRHPGIGRSRKLLLARAEGAREGRDGSEPIESWWAAEQVWGSSGPSGRGIDEGRK